MEGELTSAAIQAIRCRNDSRHFHDTSTSITSEHIASNKVNSPSEPENSSHMLLNATETHTCGATRCRTNEKESTRSIPPTRDQSDNQYTCVCRLTVPTLSPKMDGISSTELSNLRSRQEALAERIQTLQVSWGLYY